MATEKSISKLAEIKNNIINSTPARDRLTYLFDEGTFTELDVFSKQGELTSGVITAYGYVDGSPVYAFSQDITVNNGALGENHAKKIKKVYDLAAKTGVPVVGIYDSFGAVISDGIKALSAYGELLMWASNLSGVVPQISVIAGTCASSSAMLATSADFVIMAKDAELFITPNSKDAVSSYAENSAKCGTAQLVCEDDKDAVENARAIITKLPMNNLATIPVFEFEAPAYNTADDAVSLVEAIADVDSVIELSADFGTASYTALASMGGSTVGFVATNKADAKLTADDCSKLSRFIRTCDAFAIPVITFVDTEGFDLTDGAEQNGSLRDMTKLAHSYAEATTAKISLIVKKAYGPAYIALAGKGANADLTFAYPDAVISALAPETAVEFLMHDELKGAEDVNAKRKALAEEYCATTASAFKAAEDNCIDDIINPVETRAIILNALDILSGKRISRLPKKHSNMPF